MKGVYGFLFQVYPYVCFMVFVLGSLIRFDQSQYSWKSDSSQMLRAGTLRWGSNLFHFGVLFLFFGHMVGLFTPHSVYGIFMSAATKQMMAVVAGARRPLRVMVLVSPRPPCHGSGSARAGKMNSGRRASMKTRSRMPFCIIARMAAGTVDRTS